MICWELWFIVSCLVYAPTPILSWGAVAVRWVAWGTPSRPLTSPSRNMSSGGDWYSGSPASSSFCNRCPNFGVYAGTRIVCLLRFGMRLIHLHVLHVFDVYAAWVVFCAHHVWYGFSCFVPIFYKYSFSPLVLWSALLSIWWYSRFHVVVKSDLV